MTRIWLSMQLQDSSILDKMHLMGWELGAQRYSHEKTWVELKTYSDDEYEAILAFAKQAWGIIWSLQII